MGTSATQRSLAYLKRKGYKTGVCERWISNPAYPGGGKRIDLFGTTDLIAIKPGEIWAVQSTGTGFSEHHKKLSIEKEQDVIDWLEAGGLFLLISWRKLLKKRGGKLRLWKPRLRFYELNEEGGLIWKDVDSIDG